MDVHKNTVAIAVAEEGDSDPATVGEFPNSPTDEDLRYPTREYQTDQPSQ